MAVNQNRKRLPAGADCVPPSSAQAAQRELRRLGSPAQAAILARFFKTGPGEYGEGDRFIGVKVPVVRDVARQFRDLPLRDVETLLHSEIHEERLLALVILVGQFSCGGDAVRTAICDLYLANTRWINNWDLVDLSAPAIVGGYLADRSRKPLYRLARSASLWERRIGILATHWFIRHGDCADTLKIAKVLLGDREDLIHKAVGWMLREVGKRDLSALESFLDQHCRAMPRTMLRYALERLPEAQRRAYMAGSAAVRPKRTRSSTSGSRPPRKGP